jgi:hypothetical protein
MELTLSEAENFVDSAASAQWNGWTIEVFTPAPNAFMRSTGAFHKGKWCLKSTIGVNNEGKYVITKRNAINARKSWN